MHAAADRRRRRRHDHHGPRRARRRRGWLVDCRDGAWHHDGCLHTACRARDQLVRKTLRPGHRNYLGHVSATVQDQNYRELALADNSRSGDQWDIWEAVYSPQGEDGYPKRIFDKVTGDIDPAVANYWKENYDLRYILERDWKTLGPKLEGKIHIYCGDMDNYYLNNAVYLMEDFLKKTNSPFYKGEVEYGDRAEHCWNGDHENPNYISRLRYNTLYLPKILKRIQESASKNADVKSWRY